MTGFIQTNPTADAYWRSVILFGKNSASNKFALGKSLLEIADQDKIFASLEELAEPYARNLGDHLQICDRQGPSPSSRFLEACRKFSRGEIAKDELLAQTARLGFANVNQAEIPVRIFVDERGTRGGINLTLHRRNEYLIGSHHPLREALMTQIGRTEPDRRSFLQEMESFAMHRGADVNPTRTPRSPHERGRPHGGDRGHKDRKGLRSHGGPGAGTCGGLQRHALVPG